uniref:FBD domain-containing protein n=1 Tax=Leersia perrieri TaxID=77586 RepID=A0A0D9XQ43_9ORYZ
MREIDGVVHRLPVHLFAFFNGVTQWCPKFTKLKTLLVNDWFMTSNMSELASLLEHAPLVEKLTLELSKLCLIDGLLCTINPWVQQFYLPQEPQNFMEIEDSDKPLKPAFPIKNLKIAEIKYQEGDERVKTIVKILNQNGVPLENINVLQIRRQSRLF